MERFRQAQQSQVRDPSLTFSIQIMSDLHVEFPTVLERLPPFEVKAPVLALLGDIGCPGKTDKYERFILSQADRFELVLVVAGNHEYYNAEYYTAKEQIRKICAQRTNIVRTKHFVFLFVFILFWMIF
jgi:predicted phosphodiesterase